MTSPGQVPAVSPAPAQGDLPQRLAGYRPPQLTPEQVYLQQRERLCRLGDDCPCDHTRCTKGWWDEERTFTRNGQTYSQVARCPTCHSAWLAHVRLSGAPAPVSPAGPTGSDPQQKSESARTAGRPGALSD